MIKLHIGCGKRIFPDFINIDGADYPHIHYKDVTKLPFENNSVDLIYSSHLIAYFDRQEIVPILSEWKRVLKKNGIMRIATPDFEQMAWLYIKSKKGLDNFLGPMYGRMLMNDKIIHHKTVYDFDSIKELLEEKVGMRNIKLYNWRETEHSAMDDHSQDYIPKMDKENGVLISLNVQCEK